jgi:peroxiredoxin Q/BCP
MPENTVAVDKPIPSFKLAATGDQTLSLQDYKGQNVVLYFYPKDATPGCTTEAEDFRDYFNQFVKANTVILGVSRDSLDSHENFKEKKALPFELLSDSDEKICQMFDVIQDKNMYGKIVRGIERSTFLIDKKGVLRQEWRKVKVQGHVIEVLAAAQELK